MSKQKSKEQEVRSEVMGSDNPITAEDARELLGWTIVPDEERSYALRDRDGKKVCCKKNTTNRFLYPSVVETLVQEHLRKRWRLNGEPIIVGSSGLILNGQHTLVSLILAAQDWAKDSTKWPAWPEEPTMEKVIVYGVDESDEVVNTMDTCKPRNFMDVVGRSGFFHRDGLSDRDLRECARMTDYAVKLLWHRTGAGLDAFAPRRTHAEALDFLARHPKLLDAVRHVREENGGKDGRVVRYCSPGCLSGLMYLFAVSKSDATSYFHGNPPSESHLDLTLWDRACEFVVLLATSDAQTKAVRQYLATLANDGADGNAARWGVLVNAWLAFAEGNPITPSALRLEFSQDDEERRQLLTHPSCGGIDLGDPQAADEAAIVKKDPTPAEIEERAKEVRTRKATLKPSRAGDEWADGDVAWVRDAEGRHYLGTISGDIAGGRALVDAMDGTWEVRVDDLSLTRPEDSPQKETPKVDVKKRPFTKKTAAGHAVGDLRWVSPKKGDPWQGRVVEITDRAARLKIQTGHPGAGNVVTAALSDLRREQPTA